MALHTELRELALFAGGGGGILGGHLLGWRYKKPYLEIMKTCKKCGEAKAAEAYAKRSSSKDGLQDWCKACAQSHYVKYRNANRTSVNDKSRERYAYQKATGVPAGVKWKRLLRLSIIEHYGGECACCKEQRIEFLCVDHTNGGGTKHRKELGRVSIYSWIKKNGYPDGFRVLCWNCNSSMGMYGYSPANKNFR